MQLRSLEMTEKKLEVKASAKPAPLKEPLTFRILPRRLSITEFQPDFSLIPTKEWEKIKKLTAESKDDKRFSKETLKSTYDHVVLNRRHYAIQGLAGQGVYGKVEYAQDLDDASKTFYVLKTQNYNGISQNEFKYLNTLKRTVGQFTQESIPSPAESKHPQHAILMQLAPGATLSDLIDEETPLATISWVKIIISMLEQLQFLHTQNILHLDVKPGNFVIHLAEDRATLIDFGLSIDCLQAMSKQSQGSPAYLAPEVKAPDAQGMRHYSEKSDIYALGISIGQMLGLTYDMKIIDEKHPKFASATQIKDSKIRSRLLTFLHSMTHPSRVLRPSLTDCLHFFAEIKQNLIETIGILDAKELIQSTNWASLLEGVKQVDKLILVDTQGYDERTHLKLKELLEDKHGIHLANKLFVEPGREFSEVAELVTDYMQQNEENAQLYFGFSCAEHKNQHSACHFIQINEATDYKTEIEWARENHPITQAQRHFLQEKLTQELKRFAAEHKVECAEVISRKQILTSAMGLFGRPTTTYHDAYLELDRVATRTRHTNPFKAFLAENNIYHFAIKGHKEIENIKTQFAELGMRSRKLS